MVAQSDYLPRNERERAEASEVLIQNPDIREMVERIAGHAASYFGWMTVSLDTKQYDDWDPPLRMTITVPFFSEESWTHQYREFRSWLVRQADYDMNRLSVMVLSQKTRTSHS
jgi:hypothetical protein